MPKETLDAVVGQPERKFRKPRIYRWIFSAVVGVFLFITSHYDFSNNQTDVASVEDNGLDGHHRNPLFELEKETSDFLDELDVPEDNEYVERSRGYDDVCMQPIARNPKREAFIGNVSTLDIIASDSFRNDSLERFKQVLNVPSVSYDDMGPVDEDPRWKIFSVLEEKLRSLFPTTFGHIKFERVAGHGFLFTWEGSDSSLKPIVFMAHQDVVPVAESSLNLWLYPPFNATYHDGNVYARGAVDDKSSLVAIFETFELLAKSNWTPKRTVIASIGFDEEISGFYSAKYLADRLYSRYGPNGVELILDEGGFMLDFFGKRYVAVSVSEKGYVDVELSLKTAGGHSSVPPARTNIELMSELILEQGQFHPNLIKESPFFASLQCFAKYSPKMHPKLRHLIKKGDVHRLSRVLSRSAMFRYFFTTSKAVDVIKGGVKANALPEQTVALVNHRIAHGNSIADVKKFYKRTLVTFAKHHHLILDLFNETLHEPKKPLGYLSASMIKPLEPAPISPYGPDAKAFHTLGAAIKHTFGNESIVVPTLMPANTDTRHYWNVSENIFRWTPVNRDMGRKLGNAHTVNEYIPYDGHMDSINFFHELIRIYDEA
ncbi:vacuolar carboxypeptidase [Schizosaccharomyces japonicus yFS275]|uniref:Vacuolar carboxypeptidase n=1 Tax=Schizosaccharomyces japonicus (strain yFS275 / FY16936) TaxID=402676 RepID=B6K4M4_SCHJY|nr:vacuolar carboxypeptidase [Schizosaccharomyces japonicus yFS275]EEB08431.1 vacuolar carboxypeptidase [Schizosaccharomyces japonicus yFS275]